CPWLEDSNDAMLVAEKLGISFQTIDLSKEYKERIVDYMFHEYEMGRTPNPDVLCNREIKFDVFMQIALSLGADFVATGHYCRKELISINDVKHYQLLAGKDLNKDQSYFLCQLSQKQLEKTLFPIGHLAKSEVRKIAREQDLITAEKKDSQGLCFIGKVKLPDFLQQKLIPKEGVVVEIPSEISSKKINDFYDDHLNSDDYHKNFKVGSKKPKYSKSDGNIVGNHSGAHFFTKGQRKGLAIGGTPEPLFVIDTDIEENVIYAGQGKTHPGLYRSSLFVKEEEIHWVRQDLKLTIGETLDVQVRIRYRQVLQKARLHKEIEGMYISFDDPQLAIAEGQFAVWYIDDELLGSGVIS
ncbi:MAG: tRNA 2-thiouridine(34) synthase MnmA, partial [Leeuwenhoekiella sp.]